MRETLLESFSCLMVRILGFSRNVDPAATSDLHIKIKIECGNVNTDEQGDLTGN